MGRILQDVCKCVKYLRPGIPKGQGEYEIDIKKNN